MSDTKKDEKDKPVEDKPVPPKKRWWVRMVDADVNAVGEAIGNEKFDQ